MSASSELEPESWEIPNIFLAAPFGVCLIDAHGTIRAANLESCRILRLPANQEGRLFPECGDEPSMKILADLIEREAKTAAGLAPTSIRFALHDGGARHLEFSSIRSPSMPPGGFLLLLHEVAIDDSQYDRSILQSLMEFIPDSIYFKDRESRFLRINRSVAVHFGFSQPEQAVGKTDFEIFTSEHAQQAYDEEQEILRSGVPVINREEKETLYNGRVYWVSTTKMPFRDQDDQIIGTFGISRDISEYKRFEQNLLDERNLLRTLIDLLPSRIFTKDTESRFIINNRAHLDQLGAKTQDQATGKQPPISIPVNAAGRRSRTTVRFLRRAGQSLATRKPIWTQAENRSGR
jgi:PAS domain S-box-containing protein